MQAALSRPFSGHQSLVCFSGFSARSQGSLYPFPHLQALVLTALRFLGYFLTTYNNNDYYLAN